MRNPIQRKYIHWIAALAILMNALAPAVSQAFSVSKNGKGFAVEICTTSGTKLTQIIGDDETSSTAAMDGHCPYCVIQPIYLLPTAYTPQFVAPQSFGADLSLAHLPPIPSSAWLNLPSRAPPALS